MAPEGLQMVYSFAVNGRAFRLLLGKYQGEFERCETEEDMVKLLLMIAEKEGLRVKTL